ncbi:MAG TPA: hypothetical protein VIM11_09860 [Tepidisphaeraceae bacterium]
MTIGSAAGGGESGAGATARTDTITGLESTTFDTPGLGGVLGLTAGCGLATVLPVRGGIGISGAFGTDVTGRIGAWGAAACGWTIASINSGTGTPLLQRGQRTFRPAHSSGTPIF